MRPSPCKDCQDRVVGCHSKCEKYATYRAGVEKDKKRRNEMKAIDDAEISAKIRTRGRYKWNRSGGG